ncbi:hypothetical protein OKW11_003934 [Pseudomonas baetica]|nr:hypothetical protein [Pseudomonas baetica]
MNLTRASSVRHEFYKAVWFYFKVVWPIFSILLLVIVAFGLIIAHLEGWSPDDGVYFAFVTGLTIGYGELRAQARRLASAGGAVGVQRRTDDGDIRGDQCPGD